MFRFTIRELVLVTTLVAIGAARWVDRRNLIGANRHLESEASDWKDSERHVTNVMAFNGWCITWRTSGGVSVVSREHHEEGKRKGWSDTPGLGEILIAPRESSLQLAPDNTRQTVSPIQLPVTLVE
jgi:hypothetical protein